MIEELERFLDHDPSRLESLQVNEPWIKPLIYAMVEN